MHAFSKGDNAHINLYFRLYLTQLQTYAMGKTIKTNLGFVIRQCNGQRVTTLTDNRMEIENFITSLMVILTVGIYAIQILVFSVLAVMMRRQMADIVRESQDNSYNHYGLPWGIAVTSLLISCVIVTLDVTIVKENLQRKTIYANFIPINAAIYFPVVFAANIILSVITAKGHNTNVPGLFTIILAIFVCGNISLAKYLATVIGLWSTVTAIQLFVLHSFFIFLALLAEPEEVICMVILYLFAIFCSIHLLAVIFTLIKIHRTQKHTVRRILRGIGYGLAFTLLMIGALCIGFLITSAGEMESFSPNSSTTYSTIHRFISPVILGFVGWSINGASKKWLEQMQDMRPKRTIRRRKKLKATRSPEAAEMIELQEALVLDTSGHSGMEESRTE